jgi:hypothetical protein
VLGNYTLWYIATDPSGNKDSVSRLVRVRDTEAPVIDLLGINDVNLPRWKEYVDPPVAIVDNYNTDASLRGFLVVNISLPNNKEGKPFGDVEGLFNATYSVRDSSGNQSEIAIRRIFVGPPVTALEEQMNLPKWLRVYPNPSNGIIKIGLLEVQSEDLAIQILDLQGKQVLQTNHAKNNLMGSEIDLSTLTKGVYLVKITIGEHTYHSRIQLN